MGKWEMKAFTYDGNACLLYDYMISKKLTEEEVSNTVSGYGIKCDDVDVWCWIQYPESIPFWNIPALCVAIDAPLEALFMESRILNGLYFSLSGRILRVKNSNNKKIQNI